MQNTRQINAFRLWQLLPHALVWTALLLMSMAGYSTMFQGVLPALPLMIALILSWEAPPVPALFFSLFASGLAFDLLAGQPVGMTALSWALAYGWQIRQLRGNIEDTPFSVRWMHISGILALYLLIEIIICWSLKLAIPALSYLVMRWLGMVLLIPLLTLGVCAARRRLYRKLWILLPPEIKPR